MKNVFVKENKYNIRLRIVGSKDLDGSRGISRDRFALLR